MKYDYTYKRKAVEKYRKGEWMKTPERANETNFRQMIRKWVRLEYACSSEVLKQKNRHKEWSAEERYELVAKVLAGKSIKSVAFSVAIDDSMLSSVLTNTKQRGKNHPTRVGTRRLMQKK